MITDGFSVWPDYRSESTKNLYKDVGVKRGMIMIQRLRLLLVTLFALYSSTTFALSLGEIELKSALNQRFEAEIFRGDRSGGSL